MKKNLLAALLVLCGLIVAQTTGRKAVVTTNEGTVQEVTIVDESSDSIRIKVLNSVISMPKSGIRNITYPESGVTLEKVDQKLDTVITMQKNTYAALKNNPLGSKKYGFEVNLPRLLYIKDEYFSATGTFSLFGIDRKAEIAFPFYYGKNKNGSDENNTARSLQVFTLDCQYRYFLNFFDNVQNGFWISGGARYANLHGTLGEDDNLFDWGINGDGKKDTENKLGLGFGFGYRVFSKKGLYWGFSFTAGRYVTGKSNRFTGGFLTLDDDDEQYYDFELLKFGWAF